MALNALNIITTAAAGLLCALCGYKMIRKSPLPERSRAVVTVDKFCDKYALLILALIFALAVFTRFYKLTEIPNGVNLDEASAAYSAFTLSEYGVDRHLNPCPVYFQNLTNGQSALYIWLTALIYEICNVTSYNLFAIRFTTALFSALTVIFAYFLALNLFGSKRGALLGSFIAAATPFFIMSGRFGLDCFLMLPFFTLSLMCLSFAINKNAVRWYLIAGVSFGITLYTYAISYMAIPAFLFLMLLYLILLKKITLKEVLALGVPLFLLALPLLLYVGVNYGLISVDSVPSFIPYHSDFRGDELTFSNVLVFLKTLSLLFTVDMREHFTCVPAYYTVYLFSAPLVLFGAVCAAGDVLKSFKKQTFSASSIALGALLSGLFAVSTSGYVHTYKCNAVYISFALLIVRAVMEIERRTNLRLELFAALYAVYFALFSNYYFNSDDSRSAEISCFAPGLMDSYSYAREAYPERTFYIYINKTARGTGHIFTLLADFEDPYYFAKTQFKSGETSYGMNTFRLPIFFDENNEVVYESDKDGVYLIYKQEGETVALSREYLEENGFVCEEQPWYWIYTYED